MSLIRVFADLARDCHADSADLVGPKITNLLQVVDVNGSPGLPAIDGSQLLGVSSFAGEPVYIKRTDLVATANQQTLSVVSVGTPIITLNGVVLRFPDDFTFANGVVTFSAALNEGALISVFSWTPTPQQATQPVEETAQPVVYDGAYNFQYHIWPETNRNSSHAAGQQFGIDVDVTPDGEWVLVASLHTFDYQDGAGYLYRRNTDGTYSQDSIFSNNDVASYQTAPGSGSPGFGRSVAISKNAKDLFIGACTDPARGNVYHFELQNDGTYLPTARMASWNPQPRAAFGQSVTCADDGRLVAVGEPLSDHLGHPGVVSSDVGAVTILVAGELSDQPPTDNGDGTQTTTYTFKTNPDGSKTATYSRTTTIGEEPPGGVGQRDWFVLQALFTQEAQQAAAGGEATRDQRQINNQFGTCVSMTADGQTLAVSAWGYGLTGEAEGFGTQGQTDGRVFIFNRDNDTGQYFEVQQIDPDPTFVLANSEASFGRYKTCLSDNGQELMVSYDNNRKIAKYNRNSSGVYELQNDNWLPGTHGRMATTSARDVVFLGEVSDRLNNNSYGSVRVYYGA